VPRRRLLIGLFVAVVAGSLVWRLLLPRPPTPRAVLRSAVLPLRLDADGRGAEGPILAKTHGKLDLATGAEVAVPTPTLEEGWILAGGTPSLFWTRRFVGPDGKLWGRGPFVAYDRATLQQLAAFDPRAVTRFEQEVCLSDRLIAAWRENWFWPCLRLQVHDPRSPARPIDRQYPMHAGFSHVMRIELNPDGRHVALLLLHRTLGPGGFTYHSDTVIIDVQSGAVAGYYHAASFQEKPWSADGKTLVLESYRSTTGDCWAELWDWRNQKKLGDLRLGPYVEGETAPVRRSVLAWLPASEEWLVVENRAPWSERHPRLFRLLKDYVGAPAWSPPTASLLAVQARTGAERPLTDMLVSNPRCLLAPNNELLVMLRAPEDNSNYWRHALIPLDGPMPPPGLRFSLSLLVGLGALVLCCRVGRGPTRPPGAAPLAPS
jgi:hypothetical protein